MLYANDSLYHLQIYVQFLIVLFILCVYSYAKICMQCCIKFLRGERYIFAREFDNIKCLLNCTLNHPTTMLTVP